MARSGQHSGIAVPISQYGWHRIAMEPYYWYRYDYLQTCVRCVIDTGR